MLRILEDNIVSFKLCLYSLYSMSQYMTFMCKSFSSLTLLLTYEYFFQLTFFYYSWLTLFLFHLVPQALLVLISFLFFQVPISKVSSGNFNSCVRALGGIQVEGGNRNSFNYFSFLGQFTRTITTTKPAWHYCCRNCLEKELL